MLLFSLQAQLNRFKNLAATLQVQLLSRQKIHFLWGQKFCMEADKKHFSFLFSFFIALMIWFINEAINALRRQMRFLGNLLPTVIDVDIFACTKASKFNPQFRNKCFSHLSICKLDHQAGEKLVYSTIGSSVTTKTLAVNAIAIETNAIDNHK